MNARRIVPALAGIAVFSALGYGQAEDFTITHGGWTYSETDLAGDGTRSGGGTGDFIDPFGTDHMFQNFWWYSTPFTGRELALGNLVNLQVGTNSARVTYQEDNGPNGPGALTFDFEYTLHQLSGGTGVVQIGWKIHNNSNQTVPVRFYSYTDFDLGGTAGGDTGTYTPDGQFDIVDGAVSAGLLASGTFFSGWEQALWPSTRAKLTDADFDVLNNGTSPLGPDDLAHAFSWETELLPNGSSGGRDQMVGSLIKFVNSPVPEPASLAALAIGAAALLRRRRK
jgi:hypothetical protein